MRFLIAFVGTIFLLAQPVSAQTRCYTDNFGNTTCQSADGGTVRGYTDNFGNSTFRDNNGSTVRCYTDSFGNTTCR